MNEENTTGTIILNSNQLKAIITLCQIVEIRPTFAEIIRYANKGNLTIANGRSGREIAWSIEWRPDRMTRYYKQTPVAGVYTDTQEALTAEKITEEFC